MMDNSRDPPSIPPSVPPSVPPSIPPSVSPSVSPNASSRVPPNALSSVSSSTASVNHLTPSINTEDAKLFEFPLAENRDFTRVNRACATLQANVMSLISRESMVTIQDTIKSKKRKGDNLNDTPSYKRLSTLVKLAIDTNDQAKNLFNKCQRTVSKVVAERYSSSQHNLMLRTTKYGEPIVGNEGLSPCIATENINEMYRNLLNKPSTEHQVTLSVASQVDSINDDPSNDDNITPELDRYLKTYCNSVLPPVKKHLEYNTPYEISHFLANMETNIKWTRHPISVFTMMTYLIKNNLVPVKKSTLYRFLDLYLCKSLHVESKWAIVTTPGVKPLLSMDGFNYLVGYIQDKTLGGLSFPLSKIKTLVKERIEFEWRKNNKKKGLPRVSKITLHKYASRIMTQKVFNILSSINRKT